MKDYHADKYILGIRFCSQRAIPNKKNVHLLRSLQFPALSIGAYVAIVGAAFGFDDFTSAELLNIPWNPDSLTAMGCMGLILLLSLLTLLSMSCFTLFLSSRIKNPIVVLAVAIAVALIPTVILVIGADGNVLD